MLIQKSDFQHQIGRYHGSKSFRVLAAQINVFMFRGMIIPL